MSMSRPPTAVLQTAGTGTQGSHRHIQPHTHGGWLRVIISVLFYFVGRHRPCELGQVKNHHCQPQPGEERLRHAQSHKSEQSAASSCMTHLKRLSSQALGQGVDVASLMMAMEALGI